MTLTRPPASPPSALLPARWPARPAARSSRPAGSSADPGRQGGFAHRRDTASASPPGPPCSVCWPPDSARSSCLSSTLAGLWPATWPPRRPWSSCSWAAWSGTNWRTRSWPAATASAVPATVGFFGGLRHGRAYRPGLVSELELPSPRRSGPGRRGRARGQPAAGRARRGCGGHPVRAGRWPAARSRGRGRGLDKRPAGRGQPRAGGGAGWRADRPSARVGALGRSHPCRTDRGPFRPGLRGDPHRRRAYRAGARSSDRPLVRADGPADGRRPPGPRPARCAPRPRWPGYGSATSCCRTAGWPPPPAAGRRSGPSWRDGGGSRGAGPNGRQRPRTRCGTSMASCPAW